MGTQIIRVVKIKLRFFETLENHFKNEYSEYLRSINLKIYNDRKFT